MVKEWPSIYSRWFYKTFRQELPWTSQKNLHTYIQAPLFQSIFRILMQGPLREDLNRISARSSHKNLYKIMHGHIWACTRSWKSLLERTSPGCPIHLLIRICATSLKDLLEDFSRVFTRSSPVQERASPESPQHLSKNAAGACTIEIAILFENLQQKCRAPEVSPRS